MTRSHLAPTKFMAGDGKWTASPNPGLYALPVARRRWPASVVLLAKIAAVLAVSGGALTALFLVTRHV